MYVVQYSIILKTFLVVENRLFFNIVFKNYICWSTLTLEKKPATKETSTNHHTDSLEKKEVIKSL